MRYGQYFKGNEALKTDLSPVIQNKFIKTIRALGTVAIQGFMFFFSLLVFMTIAVSIPKNSYTEPVFIVLVFLFFFLYVRYLAYFYGFVGQRWREDAFERWFRAWRMHDLIEYLDSKKILNLKSHDP